MLHLFGILVVLLSTSVEQVLFIPSSAFTTQKTTKNASVSFGAKEPMVASKRKCRSVSGSTTHLTSKTHSLWIRGIQFSP